MFSPNSRTFSQTDGLFAWRDSGDVGALTDTGPFLSQLAALRGQISDLDGLEREMAVLGFSLRGASALPGDAGATGMPARIGDDLVFVSPDGLSFGLKAADAAGPVSEAAAAVSASAGGAPVVVAASAAPLSPAPDASVDSGTGGEAMGAGFWGRILQSVERTVDRIDSLTDFVADYLDQPGVSPRAVEFMTGFLEMMDNLLVRLDGFLDVVDRWAPPRFDDWIDDVRDRIAEERDDIDMVLNPPAPVEPPVEEDPAPEDPVDETPEDDGEDAPEQEWSAEDFTGEGKTVVVVDTGWNTEFLGSDETPVDQFDFFSNDGSAQVSSSNDHGSWVDQVIRTVADGVEMIHLKVFPDTSGSAPFSVIEAALNWVIDAVEADSYDISAVNLSLGYGNVTSEVSTGLSDEFAALDDLGVFSVLAAGNSGAYGVQYLAADENTIAVSASTSSGDIAGFSQHHEELTDIFALGQSVRIEKENGGIDSVSGTSFSAPYVSGIAARLQEAADELIDRSLTDDEFIHILQSSGSDLDGYTGDADPDGYHIADADSAVGYFIDNYTDFV